MRSFIAACLFAFAVAQDDNDAVVATAAVAEEEFEPAAECYTYADAIARFVMSAYGADVIRVFGSDSWTPAE